MLLNLLNIALVWAYMNPTEKWDRPTVILFMNPLYLAVNRLNILVQYKKKYDPLSSYINKNKTAFDIFYSQH